MDRLLKNGWVGQIGGPKNAHLNRDRRIRIAGLIKKFGNGKAPIVKMINGVYEKVIKLPEKAMAKVEKLLILKPGLEKWAVEIAFYQPG